MRRRGLRGLAGMLLLVAILALVGTMRADAQFPILDMMAQRVVEKFQSATCEELWQRRGQHSEREQRAVEILREHPEMRDEFFNRVAGPVMNKMFECGMIP